MKFTIEVNLDAQGNAKGSVLKEMLHHLMRALDDVPDWADVRSILRERPNEPYAILAEAMDVDHTKTEGRVVIHREEFNSATLAKDQIERLGRPHTIEEHVLR